MSEENNSNNNNFGTQFDFAEVLPLINANLDCRIPVMMRGRHGVGKSEVVRAIAKKRGLEVVEVRASQLADVGDLVGIPAVDGKVTRFTPMDRLYKACNEPVILFLDEVDRGHEDITQAFMELTDSRKIAGQHLHEDTLVIAATNGGDRDGTQQYTVRDFDPAVMDRWSAYDVEPSVRDWLAWGAEGNIHKSILEFISENAVSDGSRCNFLENYGEHQPNRVYPSRRSWKRFNDMLVKQGLLEKDTYDSLMIMRLGSGVVGLEAATSFIGFLDNYKFEISIDELLLGTEKIDFSDWGATDHAKLMSNFTDLRWLAGFKETEPDEAEKKRVASRIGDWLNSETFPADARLMFLTTMFDQWREDFAVKCYNTFLKDSMAKVLIAQNELEEDTGDTEE